MPNLMNLLPIDRPIMGSTLFQGINNRLKKARDTREKNNTPYPKSESFPVENLEKLYRGMPNSEHKYDHLGRQYRVLVDWEDVDVSGGTRKHPNLGSVWKLGDNGEYVVTGYMPNNQDHPFIKKGWEKPGSAMHNLDTNDSIVLLELPESAEWLPNKSFSPLYNMGHIAKNGFTERKINCLAFDDRPFVQKAFAELSLKCLLKEKFDARIVCQYVSDHLTMLIEQATGNTQSAWLEFQKIHNAILTVVEEMKQKGLESNQEYPLGRINMPLSDLPNLLGETVDERGVVWAREQVDKKDEVVLIDFAAWLMNLSTKEVRVLLNNGEITYYKKEHGWISSRFLSKYILSHLSME